MRYLAPCIEQLHSAAEHLDSSNAVLSRIALILTDNIVELMAHRACIRIVRWNPLYKKLTSRQKQRALGDDFASKLSLLAETEEITIEQAKFAGLAHRYRNTAYHRGVLFEPFLFELACAYHDVACQIFSLLKNPYIGWSPDDLISAAVRHHMNLGDSGCMPRFKLQPIAESLSQMRPIADRTLREALERSMLDRLEYAQSAVESLIDYAVHEDSVGKMARQMLDGLPASTLGPWNRRADGIGKSTSRASALDKYWTLSREMEVWEEAAIDGAVHVDGYIEHLSDMARGK